MQENVSEKSVISAKAPESENAKNDNSENTADADYDENEDYVDDDFFKYVRFSVVSITFSVVVWLRYPDVLVLALKSAIIEAENLVLEQRIIEANQNVTLIWGRNGAENVV